MTDRPRNDGGQVAGQQQGDVAFAADLASLNERQLSRFVQSLLGDIDYDIEIEEQPQADIMSAANCGGSRLKGPQASRAPCKIRRNPRILAWKCSVRVLLRKLYLSLYDTRRN